MAVYSIMRGKVHTNYGVHYNVHIKKTYIYWPLMQHIQKNIYAVIYMHSCTIKTTGIYCIVFLWGL